MPDVGIGNTVLESSSLYYWDGATWQKWTGSPVNPAAQLYYWDGAAWQKWLGNPTTIQAQDYRWYGGAWVKSQGIPLNYCGDKSELVFVANGAAGYNLVRGTLVPAGEIWTVQAIAARNINTATILISLKVTVNAVDVLLVAVAALGIGGYIVWAGQVTLSAGDSVAYDFSGGVLNDDLALSYHAIKTLV
jgi:hypothetical protein